MRKNLTRVSAIILPGLLVVIATIVVSQKINERHQLQTQKVSLPPGALLPRGPLVNLQTRHDDYNSVTMGKALLVFVTTDCDACRKELATVSQAAPSLASKVTIYGVGIEDPDSVKDFIKANPVAFPMLLDHGASILSRLGFRLMPTKVLLQNGVVTKIWYGSSPDQTALIKDMREAEVK